MCPYYFMLVDIQTSLHGFVTIVFLIYRLIKTGNMDD